MQTPNVLGTPEYLQLPECDNVVVGSISRDELDIAWLAGIIDGEGSMGFSINSGRRPPAQIRLTVVNTHPMLIARVSQIFARLDVKFYFVYESGAKERRKDGKPTRDRLRILLTGTGSVRKVLERVLPYLTAKHDQAELLLRYTQWRMARRRSVGPRTDHEVIEMRDRVMQQLRDLRSNYFSLQRLPRRGSVPITDEQAARVPVTESMV